MKWLAFGAFVCVGVPAMALAAAYMVKFRRALFTALLASTVMKVSVNFASLESYRGPDRGFEASLTDLIALSLAISLLITKANRIRWLPYNALWYGLYLLIACISFLYAPAPLLAQFTLFKLFKTCLLYWAAYNLFREESPLRSLWAGILAAGAIETVVALHQKYLLGFYRIHGTFDHSNTIPAYFLLLIPVLLGWILYGRQRHWEFALSMTVLLGMCFVIAATMSRAGVALMGLAILSMLGYGLTRDLSARKFLIAGLFACVFAAGGLKALDSFLERFTNAPESSEQARDEFNIAADIMAEENFWGVGINCFSHVMTTNPRYREFVQIMKNEEHAGVCHHIYRLTAAEMGYAGLVVLLVMLARFLWKMALQVRGEPSLERYLLFGVLAGTTALHTVGLLEWVFRVTPVWNLFWIMSAVGVALSEKLAAERGRSIRT